MKRIINFLSFGTPESSMRLAFLMITLAVFIISIGGTFLCIFLERNYLTGIAAVVGAVSGAAFFGKAGQSFAELRGNKKKPDEHDETHSVPQ
jgi:drug/metabolite transporter (DMT)-like permease